MEVEVKCCNIKLQEIYDHPHMRGLYKTVKESDLVLT